MARPKVISMGEGSVTLNGFSKELSVQLEEYLLAFGKGEIKIPDVIETKPAPIVPTGEMLHKALGVHHDKEAKTYEVIVVKYNPTTKEALVDSIKPVGEFKALASNEFKKKVIEFGFV